MQGTARCFEVSVGDDWGLSISGCKEGHDAVNTLSMMAGVCRLVDARHLHVVLNIRWRLEFCRCGCKVRHGVLDTLDGVEFCQSHGARRGTMLRTFGLGMGATWNPFIECFLCIAVAAVCCECEPARVFFLCRLF